MHLHHLSHNHITVRAVSGIAPFAKLSEKSDLFIIMYLAEGSSFSLLGRQRQWDDEIGFAVLEVEGTEWKAQN